MDATNFAAGIVIKERWGCRAPAGGTTIGGKFYKGGQWCPDALPDDLAALPEAAAKPVKLVGSARQVAWANRLRAEKLALVEGRMTDLLHEIGKRKDATALIAAWSFRELSGARRMLLMEPEAAVIIEAFAR